MKYVGSLDRGYTDAVYSNQTFRFIEIAKDVARVTFKSCFFYDVSFEDSRLHSVAFINCRFKDCKFNKINFEDGLFQDTSFIDTRILNCRLNTTEFTQCYFADSLLEGLQIKIGEFERCIFTPGTKLLNIFPNQTIFRLCNFDGARIRDWGETDEVRFYKCVGIQSQSAWLRENLTTDANGYIAYTLKSFGEEPGEVRDTCILSSRFNDANRYKALFTKAKLEQYSEQLDVPFWEVRIAWADLADVLVPLGTDGIFYAGRYTQIREVMAK